MRYQISQDDIYDVQDDTSLIIQNEEGSLITSAVGATYAYDRRNSVVDPTAGFILTLNQEFAGLGGDTQLLQDPGAGRAPTPASSRRSWCSRPSSRAARSSPATGTRITDRFNTGGDSFRGFARNGLGPRDFCGDGDEPACTYPPQDDLDVDDALGGNYYGVLRLDASFPLGLPQEYGVYGGVFADVGSLWQPRRHRRQHGRRSTTTSTSAPRSASASSSTRRSRRCASTTRSRCSTRTTTSSSGSASPSRPGSEPWRARPGVAVGAGARAAPAPAGPAPAQVAAASPFLIINQERLLTGSEAGQEILAEEERQRDALRTEARALDASFEAEERRLTEQRPTMPPEEFRKLSDAFDARVVEARRQQDERAERAGAGI